MLLDITVPAGMAWNTWSDRPAEMVFLPLGIRLTPVLYAASTRRASLCPAREARLGRHALDGSLVELDVTHAGTRIHLSYVKSDPYAVVGSWAGQSLGEWGLRFWISLCVSAEGGETATFDPDVGAATIAVGGRFVAVVSEAVPVQVTAHESIEALVADFEANGYFHKASRGTEAAALALRFNLEMMRENRFAAAVADDRMLAIAKARAALGAPAAEPVLAVQQGRHAGALDAVRDVMGWNTLWDPVNGRAYTAVSRIWNLGRFAVWYNDQTYAAMMTGLFESTLAAANMAAAMSNATPQGNFACIVTSNDAWVDRSQAPNGALMAWLMYLRSRDRALLERSFDALARNQRWWRAHRDPDGRGLVSCGTSDVGDSLYKGTHFGARNETGMDNAVIHDEAVYDPETRTLSLIDVGLNATLALDAEILALIAAELGRHTEAEAFSMLAEASRAAINRELWDETRGVYANRRRDHGGEGGFVRSLGPTSFYPLICGAASPSQARRLLAHTDDPETFGGRYVIANTARNDPAFADNVYWRGRIWPNVNWFIWQGLRRYGFVAEASRFADKSMALFMQSWTERRMCGENYNADTGAIDDHSDNDPFYSWGAMLPLLGVAEIMDVSPWNGWEIANDGQDLRLGPLASPIGAATVRIDGGTLSLSKGADPVLVSNWHGRLSDIVMESGLFACRLVPAASQPNAPFLALPQISAMRVVAVRLDDRDHAWREEAGGLVVDLAGADRAVRLSIHFVPAALSEGRCRPSDG